MRHRNTGGNDPVDGLRGRRRDIQARGVARADACVFPLVPLIINNMLLADGARHKPHDFESVFSERYELSSRSGCSGQAVSLMLKSFTQDLGYSLPHRWLL